MPSTGFYLFLHSMKLPESITQKSVNALNGLLLISSMLFMKMIPYSYVSMPSTGFYLFLPSLKQDSNHQELCQCPQRASTYFFTVKHILNRDFYQSVNALNGLLLISSKNANAESEEEVVCQCPQRASTYFFNGLYGWSTSVFLCQCPQRASTYFFFKSLHNTCC